MDTTQKPGWQTTEFWAPMISMVVTALVALHYVPPADAGSIMGYLSAMVVGVIGLGGNVMLLLHYIRSRTQMKAAAMQLQSDRWEVSAPAVPPNCCQVPGCPLCANFGGSPPQGLTAPMQAAPKP